MMMQWNPNTPKINLLEGRFKVAIVDKSLAAAGAKAAGDETNASQDSSGWDFDDFDDV